MRASSRCGTQANSDARSGCGAHGPQRAAPGTGRPVMTHAVQTGLRLCAEPRPPLAGGGGGGGRRWHLVGVAASVSRAGMLIAMVVGPQRACAMRHVAQIARRMRYVFPSKHLAVVRLGRGCTTADAAAPVPPAAAPEAKRT